MTSRNISGYGAQYDNLNGGVLKQEYLDELRAAQQDNYDHTVQYSDGFNAWMKDRFENQRRERREEIQRMENHMFLKKDPHPMDIAINEQLRSNEYVKEYKNRIRSSWFSDEELRRRRDEQKKDPHPMDIEMRKRLS